MKCSRCGSRYPNACPVCAESETHPETPDRDGGSLLKTYDPAHHRLLLVPRGCDRSVGIPRTRSIELSTLMKADAARFACSFAVVAALATAALLWFSGCKEFAAYVACAVLLTLAVFIGIREQA